MNKLHHDNAPPLSMYCPVQDPLSGPIPGVPSRVFSHELLSSRLYGENTRLVLGVVLAPG